jgi:hypothetical protein
MSTDKYSGMLEAFCHGYQEAETMQENGISTMRKMKLVIELEMSDPEPVGDGEGLFITKLTHPALGGSLLVPHGADRQLALSAVTIDPKELNPVGELFRQLRELRKM